jgi:hypothetical protein
MLLGLLSLHTRSAAESVSAKKAVKHRLSLACVYYCKAVKALRLNCGGKNVFMLNRRI